MDMASSTSYIQPSEEWADFDKKSLLATISASVISEIATNVLLKLHSLIITPLLFLLLHNSSVT